MKAETATSDNTELNIVFCCFLVCIILFSFYGFGWLGCLVVELERELNLPRIPRLVGKSKCLGSQVRAGVVEAKGSVIQQIEKLGTKLQAGSIGQRKVFENGKVPVSVTRTSYGVLASIPERAQGWIDERARIKQSAWHARPTVGIGHRVRQLRTGEVGKVRRGVQDREPVPTDQGGE